MYAAARPARPPRGVYESPFLSRNGKRFYYCIDSRGHECGRVEQVGEKTDDEIIAFLEARLDSIDPVSQLRLVPDEPAAYPVFTPVKSKPLPDGFHPGIHPTTAFLRARMQHRTRGNYKPG